MVPLGVGLATSVRVGQAVGRADPDGARRAGRVGMGLAVLFMSLTAVAFWTVPRAIIGIYLDLKEASIPEVAKIFDREHPGLTEARWAHTVGGLGWRHVVGGTSDCFSAPRTYDLHSS